MDQYSLNIAFSAEDLKVLYTAGMNLIIGKADTNQSKPNLAWAVFKPFMQNTISWEESYGIFTSTTQPVSGSKVVKIAEVSDSVIGKLYTFNSYGVISGPEDNGGTPKAYSLVNKYTSQPFISVGLCQDINVNGQTHAKNPIFCSPVPLNNTIAMTPVTTVYIWLQSGVVSSMDTSTITSPITKLLFGDGTYQLSVKYDSSSGHFIPASDVKALEAKVQKMEAVL